jgi:hypothetical protein
MRENIELAKMMRKGEALPDEYYNKRLVKDDAGIEQILGILRYISGADDYWMLQTALEESDGRMVE